MRYNNHLHRSCDCCPATQCRLADADDPAHRPSFPRCGSSRGKVVPLRAVCIPRLPGSILRHMFPAEENRLQYIG